MTIGLSNFLAGIRGAEGVPYSGQSSTGAIGAYGLTGGFIQQWGAAAGLPTDRASYMNNPALQDQLAGFAAQSMYDKYGSWGAVANTWLTGSPTATTSAPGNMSPSSYVAKVLGIAGNDAGGSGSLPGAAGAVVSPMTKQMPQFAQLFGSNTSPDATAAPNANFATAGGAPITITDISAAGSIGAGKVQSGLVTAGGDVLKGSTKISDTATSLTQSTFNAVSDFFIRGGLGLLALILIGLALWQFGRQQEIIA